MDFLDLSGLDAAKLAELIRYHDEKYWQENTPEIDDADYDRLVEALRRLDPEHELVNRINTASVAAAGKVHHREPMLSLDKAYSLQALLEWAGKYARTSGELLLAEPKYDGISAIFDGITLATRGDGEWGEDITGKLPLIELEAPGYTGKVDRHARGEIVIRQDDFINIYGSIRKKDGKPYKNPRNAVAGIMGLKDISEMVLQKAKLTLVDYSLISIPVKFSELAEKWETIQRTIAGLPYPMDGIVLKFADVQFRKSLGSTAHHPRGEIAYKFTNRSAVTTLLGVEWSFGKNCLTPVALLEPVELSGITIKRASLHNALNIENMQLMVGDTVTVERAGDVIPYISASVPGEKRSTPWITHCPACGAELIRKGPELCCANAGCREMKLRRLLAAVRNLGIERLGEPTLRKLVEKFNINHLAELFELTAEQLLLVEGFQAKSANNLIAEIAKAKVVDEAKLLASLNIPNVGENIAALLLAQYSLDELRTLPEAPLAAINGIGPERAKAVVATLQESAAELDELLAAVTIRRAETPADDAVTVCFTGKMPEKRSFYEDIARSRSWVPVDSVSKNLTCLVCADVNGNSSKLKNARKYGVKILSLTEFLQQNNAVPAETASSVTPEAWERGELF